MSSKDYYFYLFITKWRYDDVSTALWPHQIIAIAYSIFLKCLNKESYLLNSWFYRQQKLVSFEKTKKHTSWIMSPHCCYRTTLPYLSQKLLVTKILIWPSKLSLIYAKKNIFLWILWVRWRTWLKYQTLYNHTRIWKVSHKKLQIIALFLLRVSETPTISSLLTQWCLSLKHMDFW